MKYGKPLTEVLTDLTEQNKVKKDYIVPSNVMRLENNKFVIDNVGEYDATDLFHRQMGNALSIPAKYYEAMREQKPDLLAENVNAWLSDKNKKYMVRAMEGENKIARALLSDRYRRIDNLEVALAVLPLFAGKEEMEVVSCNVSDNKFYIKVVNHKLEMHVTPGDIVQAGVVISNSEVGLGMVSVQPLVYRLVCSNGMCVNDFSEKKRHIGGSYKALENSYDLYTDETLKADDRAFMMKLRDVTMASIEEARFAQIVDRLRETKDAKITGRVQDVVELTGKAYGFNQTEQDGILNYLIRGGDLSLYGLTNAITRESQDVESYDRATELESIGWDVATMPKAKWNGLNSGLV